MELSLRAVSNEMVCVYLGWAPQGAIGKYKETEV